MIIPGVHLVVTSQIEFADKLNRLRRLALTLDLVSIKHVGVRVLLCIGVGAAGWPCDRNLPSLRTLRFAPSLWESVSLTIIVCRGLVIVCW